MERLLEGKEAGKDRVGLEEVGPLDVLLACAKV